MKRKWPSKNQWRSFFTVLGIKEKIIFLVLITLFLSSAVVLVSNAYYYNTKAVATNGGTHIEGVIGQPRFINPIYANSDADRDLVQLTFSGLLQYDKDLNIKEDLAESFSVDSSGKIYTFHLRENLRWSDGESLTTDDIIFTIQTIQDPSFKSPLQANWVGVDIEKINDLTIRFILRKPYIGFLENLTIAILPKHIWEEVEAEKFAFEDYNLQPVGSGMFKVKTIKEKINSIISITLEENKFYYGNRPYISKIKFIYFKNEEDLIKAAKKNKIAGISLTSAVNIGSNWKNNLLSLPRYFAVFFNQDQSEVLKSANVRLALDYGTNKEDIVRRVLKIKDDILISQKTVNSPILAKVYGFDEPEEIYSFNIETAKELLASDGFKENGNVREKVTQKELAFSFKSRLATGSRNKEVTELQKCLAKDKDIYPNGEVSGYFGGKTKAAVILFQEKYANEILAPYNYTKGTGSVGPSTREKLNDICFQKSDEIIRLSINLATVDQPQMIKVAEILKEQWSKIGVELNIKVYPLFQLERDIIKPRNYDALLFGEVLGAIPDPFPFWHSSQIQDPGLNLALYENSKVDKYLEDNRKTFDVDKRLKYLDNFANTLTAEIPAIFLYSPDFVYATSSKLKGVSSNKITDPAKRFIGIEDWYVKTKRIW